MIEHKNRVPGAGKTNRKLITPEIGIAFYAEVTNADDPIEPGTLIDKNLLDEILAATGITAGSSPNYTLAQIGFLLFDGATVRAKLHAAPAGSATLNVNSTGAKPVITPKGKPMPAYPAGTWITVIYNSATGNFILQGDGGSSSRFGNGIKQISAFEYLMNGFNPNYTK